MEALMDAETKSMASTGFKLPPKLKRRLDQEDRRRRIFNVDRNAEPALKAHGRCRVTGSAAVSSPLILTP